MGDLASRAQYVNETANLAALVEKELGPPLSSSSGILKWYCPMHQEADPSFVVHTRTNTFYCYGACGKGGDVIEYVRWRTGLGFIEALETLEKDLVVLPARTTPIERTKRKNNVTWEHVMSYHNNQKQAEPYFKSRGVEVPTLRAHKLGVRIDWYWMWEQHRQHCYRYTIPDYIMKGNQPLVRGIAMRRDDAMCKEWIDQNPGFCDMVIDKMSKKGVSEEKARKNIIDILFGPKYWKTPGYEGIIFNAQRLLEWTDDGWTYPHLEYIIIVESHMDVLTTEQAGYLTVQVKIGSGVSEQKPETIYGSKKATILRDAFKNVLNIFVVEDSDPAGKQYGKNMINALGRGKIITTPTGMCDANDVYTKGNIHAWLQPYGLPRVLEGTI